MNSDSTESIKSNNQNNSFHANSSFFIRKSDEDLSEKMDFIKTNMRKTDTMHKDIYVKDLDKLIIK